MTGTTHETFWLAEERVVALPEGAAREQLVALITGDPAADGTAPDAAGGVAASYRHPRWPHASMVRLAVESLDPGGSRLKIQHEGLPDEAAREAMAAFWAAGLARIAGERPTQIRVTEHGPYRVDGEVAIYDVDGRLRETEGCWHLCRCGGSRNKPFCDVTHGLKNFDGAESAGHDLIAQRRDSYDAEGQLIVYDDRSRCAHFGQCTARLPTVFRASTEPFVDAGGAPGADIRVVVSGCPSGALSFARDGDAQPVEVHEAPSIKPIADGPYRVRGGVQVIGADGEPYEVRERQTLCRCGQSRNKPFCDGSHWYAGFRDPLPVEAAVRPPSVYDWMGGQEALERLTSAFYAGILGDPDPLLEPVFRGMDDEHPRHVALWLAETFGGPKQYTAAHGGYEHMVGKHRGLRLTEAQRERWVARLVATADEVGLPADPDFRSTFLAYLEWGTRIAVYNSQPGVEPIAHAPVPEWDWGQTPPYVPQPWDAPDAAERGRDRYAAEHGARDVTSEDPPPGGPEPT